MFNGINKMNEVLELIESNLTGEISVKELAKTAALSEYEFRRIFSFVVGVPVGEYVRLRRLSLAAQELSAGTGTVSETGSKYGYEVPSSFARAF